MGFEFHLRWTTPTADPSARNRHLAEELLRSSMGFSPCPIDHRHVAEALGVPLPEILHHCAQFELDYEPTPLLSVTLALWLDSATIRLPSAPPIPCAEALRTLEPLRQDLAERGLIVENPDSLLADYERQRGNVEYVARMFVLEAWRRSALTANLSGQISTRLKPRALASRLRGVGISTEVRESSHFAGGWYVRVVDDQVHFTMERIAPEEYLVDADADAVESLVEVAARVSVALATLDWRHRFEIHEDDQTEMAAYLHHRWPIQG